MITSSNVACPRDDRAMHIFIWRTSVKEQSLTNLKQKGYLDIFCIGPIPVSPITAKSEPARRFDIRKEKFGKILDWLINKGIIT